MRNSEHAVPRAKAGSAKAREDGALLSVRESRLHHPPRDNSEPANAPLEHSGDRNRPRGDNRDYDIANRQEAEGQGRGGGTTDYTELSEGGTTHLQV